MTLLGFFCFLLVIKINFLNFDYLEYKVDGWHFYILFDQRAPKPVSMVLRVLKKIRMSREKEKCLM